MTFGLEKSEVFHLTDLPLNMSDDSKTPQSDSIPIPDSTPSSDEIRQRVLDMINSQDIPEEGKQTYAAIMETSIILAEQHPGGSKDGWEAVMKSFLDAEKRSNDGVVKDTPNHDKLNELINDSIGLLDSFHSEPDKYHSNLKSISAPIMMMVLRDFAANDMAKKTYGRSISDFINKIFAELHRVRSDDDDDANIFRVESICYEHIIREELPRQECYDFISTLYNIYKEIGRSDLSDNVATVVEKWLLDNQSRTKSGNKE